LSVFAHDHLIRHTWVVFAIAILASHVKRVVFSVKVMTRRFGGQDARGGEEGLARSGELRDSSQAEMRKRMECVWDGVSEVEMESARPSWLLDWVQRVRTSWRGWASWGWFVE
jgi:hypothetical protein